MELLALVGIVDPPRPAARASIATATKAGIRVRMITGDHAVTAAAVAGQLGIDGTVLTGAEFGAMSDEQALVKVDDIGVIARVSLGHKVRLVDIRRDPQSRAAADRRDVIQPGGARPARATSSWARPPALAAFGIVFAGTLSNRRF